MVTGPLQAWRRARHRFFFLYEHPHTGRIYFHTGIIRSDHVFSALDQRPKRPDSGFCPISAERPQPAEKRKFSMQNPLILAKNPLNLAKNYHFPFARRGRFPIQAIISAGPSGYVPLARFHTPKIPIFAIYTVFSQSIQPVKKCKFSMQNPLILTKNPLFLAKNYHFSFARRGRFLIRQRAMDREGPFWYGPI